MSKQPTLLLAEYLFFIYQSCYCFSGRCKNRQAEGFSNFQLLFCSSNCWSNFQLNSWVATWKKYGHLNANRYHCQVLLLSLVSSTSKTEKQFKKFTTECIFKVHFIMRVLQFVADTLNIPSFWTTPNFFQQQCKKHLFAQQRYRRATVLYLLLLKNLSFAQLHLRLMEPHFEKLQGTLKSTSLELRWSFPALVGVLGYLYIPITPVPYLEYSIDLLAPHPFRMWVAHGLAVHECLLPLVFIFTSLVASDVRDSYKGKQELHLQAARWRGSYFKL